MLKLADESLECFLLFDAGDLPDSSTLLYCPVISVLLLKFSKVLFAVRLSNKKNSLCLQKFRRKIALKSATQGWHLNHKEAKKTSLISTLTS